MARKKHSETPGADWLIYWILAGLIINGYELNRDREMGIGLFTLNMALGGLFVPFFALGKGCSWANEHVRIRLPK